MYVFAIAINVLRACAVADLVRLICQAKISKKRNEILNLSKLAAIVRAVMASGFPEL
jgi:hypothetical protein